ncbi:MAG TPA: hypothetical protein DD435_14525 [Cyanobacteria bacterium UBA8530]|nr:hypothetical protein [Cyanobacteria bacterium UBA8530]
MLDADEILEAESKDSLRSMLATPLADAYSLEIVNLTGKGEGRQLARIVRLFRNRPSFRYEGRIHEQVLPSLERAGIDPLPAEARIIHRGYLDQTLLARGKYQRNLELLLKEKEDCPDDPEILFNLGQTYKLMGRDEEAERHYRGAGRRLKENKKAGNGEAPLPFEGYFYFSFTDLLRKRGKSEEALALAKEGLAKFPRYSDLLFAYGQALLDQNLVSEALEAFEKCLRLEGHRHEGGTDPGTTSYKAWLALGVCHERSGRLDQALDCLQRAIIASPPGEVAGRLNRGILLSKAGRISEGDQDFLAVLKIDENRFEAWQNLGANAFQRGDLSSAREAFVRANALSPSSDLGFLIEKIASLLP